LQGKESMTKYKYGQFAPEHLENTKEGVLLFNQQKYWECHEVLEDHWLEGRGDNARYVYWAIIQVAASMIHYRDKNLIGARGLLAKSKEKFNKIDEFKVSTDILNKNLDWKQLRTEVFAIPKEAELENFSSLFKFRFKDPSDWELL
jgi:predicted metal-dependent hydrolase